MSSVLDEILEHSKVALVYPLYYKNVWSFVIF